MVAMSKPVHLWLGNNLVACGAQTFVRSSTIPREVTCRACPRTLAMAAAEARLIQQPRP